NEFEKGKRTGDFFRRESRNRSLVSTKRNLNTKVPSSLSQPVDLKLMESTAKRADGGWQEWSVELFWRERRRATRGSRFLG
ncbi:hypothetical protein JZU54_08585, partial [bacterium]|nr:hypothetical protein [bacterium]